MKVLQVTATTGIRALKGNARPTTPRSRDTSITTAIGAAAAAMQQSSWKKAEPSCRHRVLGIGAEGAVGL